MFHSDWAITNHKQEYCYATFFIYVQQIRSAAAQNRKPIL